MRFKNFSAVAVVAAAVNVAASLWVGQVHAKSADLPLVEGDDGRSYIVGEMQITSSELRPEENAGDVDLKITLASVDAMDGCKTYKGIASVYGLNKGSGDSSTQRLAGGGRLNVNALTAAMKPPVPLRSTVHVTNKRNGKTVTVKVNDRGPYVKGRIIDLTPAAGRQIGVNNSVAPVEVKICKKALASLD